MKFNTINILTIKVEFVVLMALVMSITALSTDTILPALGVIGDTFNIHDTASKQLLVSMVFLGTGIGQIFAGALSDSFGRKPIMYIGFTIFIVFSFVSVMTDSFMILVISRILQGFGLSAPKTLVTAIIRDCYVGNIMGKVMSFVVMSFIIAPAVAPMLGAILLNLAGWQSIFYMQILISIIACLWLAIRLPETLAKEKRIKLNVNLFIESIKTFFSIKTSIIYTIALGFVLGGFITLLSTSESILIGQYHKVDSFPYLFACIAISMGISAGVNGKYVIRFGMKKLTTLSSSIFTLIPFLYILLSALSGNLTKNPSLFFFMSFTVLQVFCLGFIFGNLTSLTLEPLGKIAGMASAISGFISTVIAVVFSTVVGCYIEDTALPMFIGFFIAGLLAIACLWWARKIANSLGCDIC